MERSASHRLGAERNGLNPSDRIPCNFVPSSSVVVGDKASRGRRHGMGDKIFAVVMITTIFVVAVALGTMGGPVGAG